MKEELNKNKSRPSLMGVDKCPRNFGLWVAFVLGMGCMVLTLAVFDYLQRGKVRYEEGLLPQHGLQTVAGSVSQAPEGKDEQPFAPTWLGAEVQEIDEIIANQLGLRNNSGVLVNQVIESSPADKCGVERGDVIVRFDRRRIENVSGLQNLIAKLSPGERVQVVVVRDGVAKSLYVKLEAAPTNNIHTASTPLESSFLTGSIEENALQWGMAVSPLTKTFAQSFGIPEGESGIVVIQVAPGGRAALAGLQPGDLIRGVNSQPTPDMAAFFSAISGTREAVFDISRGAENLYLVAEDSDDG